MNSQFENLRHEQEEPCVQTLLVVILGNDLRVETQDLGPRLGRLKLLVDDARCVGGRVDGDVKSALCAGRDDRCVLQSLTQRLGRLAELFNTVGQTPELLRDSVLVVNASYERIKLIGCRDGTVLNGLACRGDGCGGEAGHDTLLIPNSLKSGIGTDTMSIYFSGSDSFELM